ncbi:hypothetical protein Tco_0523259 [Tanacetum coccineum]
MQINMLIEKKYPLKKEVLEKMLSLQLEVEEESKTAFELIKFIKSQIEEHTASTNLRLLKEELSTAEEIKTAKERVSTAIIDPQFRTNSDDDEESYATEFTDSMFNDDVDDSGNKIETGRERERIVEKEIEEKVVEKEKEDVEIEKEKNDDTNVKKIDEVVKKKDDTDVMSV